MRLIPSIFFGIVRDRRRRSASGLSLLEVMIATAVLSIAVLGMVGAFGGIQKSIQTSKGQSLGSNLAQEKMQILSQLDYYQALVTVTPSFNTSYSPSIPYDTVYFPPETILEGGVTYTRLTYIQVAMEVSGAIVVLPPSTPDTGMRLVTITVLWTQNGTTKQLSLNSLLTNPNTVMSDSTFEGTVTDAVSSAAVNGAVIDIAENMGWRTKTNASGNYSLNVNVGNYNMVVSAPGYFTQILGVSIAADQIISGENFKLAEMSSGTVSGTAWINQNLVISQVVADTYTYCGDGAQHAVEYIELFNPTTAPINIGPTGKNWYSTPNPSLWFMSSASGWVEDMGFPGSSSFDLNYVSTYVPAYSYFLISNATSFMINNTWVAADAYYQTGNSEPPYLEVMSLPANVNKAGWIGLLNYSGASGITVVDSVRWDDTGGVGDASYLAIVSTPSIPVYSGSSALNVSNSIVRISSPNANAASMTTYGHAYNSQNNKVDFQYASASFSGIPYSPHDIASGTFTVISGQPAVDAVVTADDGLSDATTSYLVNSGIYPTAQFKLINVATGTWTVLITSGAYTLENDTVTIAVSGSSYTFVSTATVLNQTTVHGFVAGTVLDVLDQAITTPQAIQVTAGGITGNANTSTGRYVLRVSSGSIDVVANPGNGNSHYVSVSSLAVTVGLGQISDGINFVLSQGGQISGFVTRDGVNGLPGVAVSAIDADGFSHDTEITDNTGKFTTIIMSTGTYTMTPELDSEQNATPASYAASVAYGATVFSTTFTISGALGTVSGTVTNNGAAITTGVLIVLTTSTLSGSPPALPTLSSTTMTSNTYYLTSSLENGTYSVGVRQSTTTGQLYNAYVYYTTVNGAGTPSIQSKTVSNISVTAGGTVTENFTFP